MRRIERVNVAMMLSGMGFQSPDVFAQASWRWEKRQTKALNRARIRMMKGKGKDAPGVWWWQGWSNLGGDEDLRPDDVGARERAAKIAAAFRRWREYSRQASGRRNTQTLPSKSSSQDDMNVGATLSSIDEKLKHCSTRPQMAVTVLCTSVLQPTKCRLLTSLRPLSCSY